MHADLVKLLDLQSKDGAVAEAAKRLRDLDGESAALDQAIQKARDGLDAARRAAAEGARRRDEIEARVESYRLLQDRRVQRLETVRNPKDASTLMAELDLARSVIAKEETDWVRAAEAVTTLERKVGEEENKVAVADLEQAPERARLAERRHLLEAERDAAVLAREASAEQIDKPLRTRYDRLRRSRARDVVVPLVGGTCGACHTSVPLNRRSQIRSGAILDGCEGCGAILYPADGAGSA
ncbi:MAG: zinc ribbon domain-containing protein [Gemmatimonadales bacterium]